MADEKTNVNGKEKVSFWTKLGRFFKNLPHAIARPFKNMWHELKKVTWPTKKEWLNSTLIVIAFMVFMGIVIGLLDMGSSALISWLVSL
ncbi:MAG: preprotein translocase subunit SecE [Clostridiales bacterium]|nr:preprotein translocase subunit SecE [Clostridiales bacterium]